MTVLLRSRSLMRGIFHHHHHQTGPANEKGNVSNNAACVITHSHAVTPLSDWNNYDDPSSTSSSQYDDADNANNNISQSPSRNNNLPPIIDDCTELDRVRRVEIAKSHGFVYDEVHGVESILHALTRHERTLLADDNMPLRHYRAEKGNLNEAIRKIKCTLKWREEFQVEDIKRCFDNYGPTADEGSSSSSSLSSSSPEKREQLNQLANAVEYENETGKIYSRGYDKQGRAILYLTPGKENSNDEYDNMRHLVYHLERAIACTRRKAGREKVCIVIGYQGFKLTNSPPMSTVKHTLMILQGHYPERMHRAYICDPPLMFRSFWKIIKMFVDSATLEKIAFCTGKEGKFLLERDFDTSTTEKQAGGTKKLREFSSKEFLFRTPFDHTFDEKRV